MDDQLHNISTMNALKCMTSHRTCCFAAITALSSFLSMGCQEKNEDVVAFLKAHEHVVSASDYSLAPPDLIRVSAPIALEVDGGVHMIRSDGKISLKLLGEVKVAGLTTQEAAAKLESLLNKYYVDPKVNIEVTGYQSKYIYVMGQVGSPGPRPFTGRDSFLDVVSRAGPTFLAWKAKIEIIRPDPVEGKRKKLVLDYEKMVREGDLTANVLLQEGDVVYVPPTPLAWMGLRVRELLFPMTPVLEAYAGPARAISATGVYQDDGNTDDDRRFSIIR